MFCWSKSMFFFVIKPFCLAIRHPSSCWSRKQFGQSRPPQPEKNRDYRPGSPSSKSIWIAPPRTSLRKNGPSMQVGLVMAHGDGSWRWSEGKFDFRVELWVSPMSDILWLQLSVLLVSSPSYCSLLLEICHFLWWCPSLWSNSSKFGVLCSPPFCAITVADGGVTLLPRRLRHAAEVQSTERWWRRGQGEDIEFWWVLMVAHLSIFIQFVPKENQEEHEFQLKGYLPSESSAPWLPFSDLQPASDTTSADGIYGQRRGAFIMRPPVPWKMMFLVTFPIFGSSWMKVYPLVISK